MALEIERKFLVADHGWREGVDGGEHFREGLLARMTNGKIRIRRSDARAWITVKGPKTGFSRSEYEYAIPLAEADEMLAHLCEGPLIEKTRYHVDFDGLTWEVDQFAGALTGLVIAEVELSHATQTFSLPPWIGLEITTDPAYGSAALIRRVQLAGNRQAGGLDAAP